MPFTLAHPAAILPFTFLKKKWYSFTGLIIGSVIPDFEGFLRPGYEKTFSHTWGGMFWFDLPLGFLAAFVFHYLVRAAIIENLPGVLYKRFSMFRVFSWKGYFSKHFVAVVLSMLIGITTHLVWDRITHTDTYGYAEKAGIDMEPEKKRETRVVLQYASTIVGVIFMMWWVWKLPSSRAPAARRVWTPYWLIVVAVAVLVWLYIPRGPIVASDYDIANTGMTGCILGVIIASALYRFRMNRIEERTEL
jgi:hypothetical protein